MSTYWLKMMFKYRDLKAGKGDWVTVKAIDSELVKACKNLFGTDDLDECRAMLD